MRNSPFGISSKKSPAGPSSRKLLGQRLNGGTKCRNSDSARTPEGTGECDFPLAQEAPVDGGSTCHLEAPLYNIPALFEHPGEKFNLCAFRAERSGSSSAGTRCLRRRMVLKGSGGRLTPNFLDEGLNIAVPAGLIAPEIAKLIDDMPP